VKEGIKLLYWGAYRFAFSPKFITMTKNRREEGRNREQGVKGEGRFPYLIYCVY
jgi:hypothetical protein